jgi:hypothetical protein
MPPATIHAAAKRSATRLAACSKWRNFSGRWRATCLPRREPWCSTSGSLLAHQLKRVHLRVRANPMNRSRGRIHGTSVLNFKDISSKIYQGINQRSCRGVLDSSSWFARAVERRVLPRLLLPRREFERKLFLGTAQWNTGKTNRRLGDAKVGSRSRRECIRDDFFIDLNTFSLGRGEDLSDFGNRARGIRARLRETI